MKSVIDKRKIRDEAWKRLNRKLIQRSKGEYKYNYKYKGINM